MRKYDVIMLCSPEFYLFSPKQDQWMHDAIQEGMGGINTASVFSIITQIHWAWANSQTSSAFPNDAMAVVKLGAGVERSRIHFVEIDQNFPDPVLTPFIPFRVEKIPGMQCSRLVIAREGAGVLAWQIGNHPGGKAHYLVAWDYGEGKTMTIGECEFGRTGGWFDYRTHEYASDIVMNMVLYMAHKDLIRDVALFHRLKSNFIEFRSRMVSLISLKDFVDKFGANTQPIQDEIWMLEELYDDGISHYLDQEFQECEDAMHAALRQFPEAEDLARRVKDNALLWVYVIEWLVTSSTLFISGSILWMLMFRRRMFKEVKVTKLR
jgi:hypothetical protein